MHQTDLGGRLRQARKEAGFKSATAAAISMGIPVPTYTSHENGLRKYDPDYAAVYGKHFGKDPTWLLYGSGGESSDDVNDNNLGSVNTADTTMAYAFEPNVQVQIELSLLESEWEMPETYLRSELKIRDDRARILEVKGDYMYDPDNPAAPGSLFPGDRVIIDVDDRRPTPPGAFAVHDGAGLTVKMIEVIPNSTPTVVRLNGRNPRYATFERPLADVPIIGRVKAKVAIV